MKQNKFLKISIIIFVTLCSVGIIYFVPIEQVQKWIQSAGVWAPVIYILCFTLLPVFFFPVPVLALAGGLCFGLFTGSLYTFIGAFFNSSFMFFMARYIGGDAIEKLIREKMSSEIKEKFDKNNHRNIMVLIFTLRLIPLVPYNVINYCAGLTKVPYKRYTIATMLGIIPGTLVFLNLGEKTIDVMSPEFTIAILALILLIVISVIISKKYRGSYK